jgi:ABC-type phosphate/phosphonate transport system substrate-binding protein
MIASLPMYDWPETQTGNDSLWAKFTAQLNAANIAAPAYLTRQENLEAVWLSPDLLLAQTCTYPLETALRGKVRYVATPSYAVEGCETPGHYRSVVLKPGEGKNIRVPSHSNAHLPDWPTDTRLAVNSLDSMSGYHALKRDAEAVGRNLPALQIITGSHRASIFAVANGTADLCAIDCVTWAMALKHEPAAKNVHVAGWTRERPGLPLITSLQTSGAVLDQLVACAHSVLGAVVLPKPTEL